MPDLTVVIPTRDRRSILGQTLGRLEEQAGDASFDVKVVDDGSTDGSPEAVRRCAGSGRLDIELIEQPGRGPAAARNRGVAATRAPVCLFLNDDTPPRAGLVGRHAAFHARRPEPEAALLGAIALPADPPPTPFMRWLHDAHFDYAGIEDHERAGGGRFFTANVSVKTELVNRVDGFDERMGAAAYEDIEFGLRLEAAGMRLAYDPEAVVEHFHPEDLESAIERLRRAGRWLAPLVERHPDWPVPRRPGARHRIKAAALTGLAASGARSTALRREIWRFLCHEASREGYWSAVEDRPPGTGLRIGRRLARLAIRDDDARLPAVHPNSMPRDRVQ